MSGWTWRIGRPMWVVAAALASAGSGQDAFAQTAAPAPSKTPAAPELAAACADLPPDSGIRFGLAGFCAKISGSVMAIYQTDLSTSGSGARTSHTNRGTSPSPPDVYTLEASATLAAQRRTPLGLFQASVTAQWLKANDDDTAAGSATVQELKAALGGATVGYTASLMDFWAEDFQFLAAAPNRSAALVSYDHRASETVRLALAVESGLPSSRQNTDGLRSLDFDAPLLTGRLLYADADDRTLHLAGLLRSSTQTTGTGWALTLGATVPVTFIAAGDYVSAQWVYAVNASPFLGTEAELSSFSSNLPRAASTEGWSIVASFHHQWSEQWEANVLASYLSLDVNATAARPTGRTTRFAGNVYWRPAQSFRLGAELGLVKARIDADGTVGVLQGGRGKALVGYLSAQWSF